MVRGVVAGRDDGVSVCLVARVLIRCAGRMVGEDSGLPRPERDGQAVS
jgi:hypothetical protein